MDRNIPIIRKVLDKIVKILLKNFLHLGLVRGEPSQKDISRGQNVTSPKFELNISILPHTIIILDNLQSWDISIEVAEKILVGPIWELARLK